MSNTSTVHIKTDFDCKVYDYDQELGTTKADTYFNVELRKGQHELTFTYVKDEDASKTITYIVEDVDCDYRLIVEIISLICNKAFEYFDGYYIEGYCQVYNEIDKAYHLFIDAAEKNYSQAQYGLGLCYKDMSDPIKARKWFTIAAEQGNANAQFELGRFYENDKDNRNIAESIKWYTKSAEQGHNGAQYILALIYSNRNGEYDDVKCCENSLSKAVKWYTKAAEQNNVVGIRNENHDLFKFRAQRELGYCYSQGYGVKKNLNEAISWYTKALKAAEENEGIGGIRSLCFDIGFCFESNKDITNAKKYYSKAAEHGDSGAKYRLNKLNTYYLCFDTETTGIPQNYNAPTHFLKNWPRLVQLSWITTDEDCNVLSENDHIIYPDGFTIPEDAARLHSITTEIAQEKGEPLKEVIDKFMEDFNIAKAIVGHNIAFDKKIIGAELIRLGQKDIMRSKKSLCTMEAGSDYCKIPSAHGYKWPKLQELHKKLFGYEFEDAHNSMSDVKATLKCFKEMKKLGWI